MNRCVLVFAWALAVVLWAPFAYAGAKRLPRALMVHSLSVANGAADVQSKLLSSGLFGAVDTFNAGAGTPTIVMLRQYDAAMVSCQAPWLDRVALGNVLKQYVDEGFGVVQTTFTTGGTPNSNLGGGWDASYNCITFGANTTGAASVGFLRVHHPILIGVEAFSGGSFSFRPSGTALSPGATLIASWSDGKPLVAAGPKSNRVDLGFFPVSSDALGSLWASNTDGIKLLVNSLLHVMRPRVLLLGAHPASWVADVQTKLNSVGLLSAVDSFDVTTATPTLSKLQMYDAVLVWSDLSFFNSVALGNVLADYVDAGGGVVVAGRSTSDTFASRRLMGRWTPDYEIIPSVGSAVETAAQIGTRDYPAHPILDGVSNLSGTGIFRPSGTGFQPGGFRIAAWNDGRTLAAASTRLPSRVDLGMLPPSSTVVSTFWSSSTSGARLMANALVYTVKPYVAVVTADPVGAPDVFVRLSATGRFSGVANIDAGSATPSPATLRPFGAVATWSINAYDNPTALGDTLAGYVDAGGGVVTAMYALVDGFALDGRWITDGYEISPSPLPPSLSSSQQFLGTVLEPNHPIASFVRKFAGRGSVRQSATPLLRGRTIMRWTDGKMLTSVHNFKKRADLGYWPVSESSTPSGWYQVTDGTWITANALEFVVRVKPCPGDLSGDGMVDDTDFVLFAEYYNALIDARGDLTGDGNTDDSDFVAFANGYNQLICP